MLENLFENAGTKIKNFARGLFVLEAAASVLGGIIMMISDEDYFLIGLLIIVAGIIAAYITSLFLTAFGDLVESAASTVEINDAILKKLNETPTVAPVAVQSPAAPSTPAAPATNYANFPASNGQGSTAAPTTLPGADTWVCKHCGTSNSKNYAMCKKCGKYRNS